MGQWLVNQDDNQFGVSGLQELKQLAADSKLWPGDMVQPEGAADWVYALEIPELKGILKDRSDDDDIEFRSRGAGGRIALMAIFFVVLCLGATTMGYFILRLPTGDARLLGEGGTMKYSEMLMTKAAPLRSEPEANASAVTQLTKNEKLDLLAKRGEFYRARTQAGQEGWVTVVETVPMYQFGGKKIREEYDPLYNPDQYVSVGNASWLMVIEAGNNVTNFSFLMTNESQYEMADLVLEAVIKDSKGTVVGTKEFPIEGTLLPEKSTFVGTLSPDEKEVKEATRAGFEPPTPRLMTQSSFEEEAKEDQELNLRWSAMINVELEEDFVEATIRVVELRALPKE